MLLRLVGALLLPPVPRGTMETDVGEADEQSRGMDSRLFEVKNGMSGGKGEEDRIQGHQV